jgi:hypothetical protein
MSPIKIAKSKTMIFSAALAALSVAQGFVAKFPVGPMEQMYIGMGIAAAIAVLRIVTTQPLSDK